MTTVLVRTTQNSHLLVMYMMVVVLKDVVTSDVVVKVAHSMVQGVGMTQGFKMGKWGMKVWVSIMNLGITVTMDA